MKLNHWHDVRDWYRAFLDAGTRADIMPLKYDWSDYKTVVLPTVLMLSAVDTQRLADFAAAGGRVVIGYATGLIDENFHTWLWLPGCRQRPAARHAGHPRRGIQHPRRRGRR